MTLSFDPSYVPNMLKGTDIFNGNREKKGCTIKYASSEKWHAVIYVPENVLVLPDAFTSNSSAVAAVLKWYAEN